MKRILRLLSYLKYRKGAFLFGFAMLATAVILELYAPVLTQQIIDEIITPFANSSTFPWEPFLTKIGLVFAIGIAAAVLRYLAQTRLQITANTISMILRNQVYDHVHKLPISYFDQVPAGTVVSRITNDTEALRKSFYVNIVTYMLINFVSLFGIYIAIAAVNPTISIALLPILPLLFLFQFFYTKRATGYLTKSREYYGQINGKINEAAKTVQMTQSFGMAHKVQSNFEALTGKARDVRLKFILFDHGIFSIPYRFSRLVTFLIVVYLASQRLDLNLPVSIGTIYLLVDYSGRLFGPLIEILDVLAMSIPSLVAADRVFAVLDTPVEKDETERIAIDRGDVVFENVHFSYTDGNEVLKGISLSVEHGESVAIVGHTGSGKSTIMNLLFRFYDPDSGTIRIDGQDTQQYNRQSIRAHMGIVLQEPFLFAGTILNNITLDNPKISRERALEALIKVGGKPLLDKFEKGIDEPVVERGQTLSSGQRQLISFARALAYDPKILILDEATSSIDTETEQLIQHAMDVVKQGRTTFVIAHRLSTIKNADRIYVLEHGEVAECGDHASLIARGGIYADMVSMQSSRSSASPNAVNATNGSIG